jgi:hypothetical protein
LVEAELNVVLSGEACTSHLEPLLNPDKVYPVHELVTEGVDGVLGLFLVKLMVIEVAAQPP